MKKEKALKQINNLGLEEVFPSESTFNGFCYKDYNIDLDDRNNWDEVIYIPEDVYTSFEDDEKVKED